MARPKLVGIGLIVISIVVLLFGIGTLVSLEYGPPELVKGFRKQHASILATHGLPQDVVRRVREGAPITDGIRNSLPPDQADRLRFCEESLPKQIASVHQAANASRRSCWLGIGCASVLLLTGTYVASRSPR